MRQGRDAMTDANVLRQLRASHQARREHSDALYAYAEGALGAVSTALDYVRTTRARLLGADGDRAAALASLDGIEASLLHAEGLVVPSYSQALETYPREATE